MLPLVNKDSHTVRPRHRAVVSEKWEYSTPFRSKVEVVYTPPPLLRKNKQSVPQRERRYRRRTESGMADS